MNKIMFILVSRSYTCQKLSQQTETTKVNEMDESCLLSFKLPTIIFALNEAIWMIR